MSDTKIEWADKVWNPTRGCTRVSEGCRLCYAERDAARKDKNPKLPGYKGFSIFTPSGPRWTGKVELIESMLDAPLRWRKPQRVFVNSMSDLWHKELPREAKVRVYAVMAVAHWHHFMVLTKRPDERLEAFSDPEFVEHVRAVAEDIYAPWMSVHKSKQLGAWRFQWPLPNVQEGVSVEDQPTANDRIVKLLQAPAAVRFVSYEPALGPVDFRNIRVDLAEVTRQLIAMRERRGEIVSPESAANYPPAVRLNGLTGANAAGEPLPGLDLIIMGSESGPGARPCNLDWVRSTRDQCVAAGVSFFWKQDAVNGKKISTPELDGVRWVQLPEVRA